MNKPKTYCRSCDRETFHFFHSEFKPTPVKDPDTELADINEYYIVECQGCGTTGFLYRYGADDQIQGEDRILYEQCFPEADIFESPYLFLKEDELSELPQIIRNIYQELTTAFRFEINTLCGVSMRMIVEGICIHQNILGVNLKNKISKLYEQGLISKNDHEIIDKLREIGNLSAHKLKSPPFSELYATLEVTNHLIRTIYIVPKRTKYLKRKNTKSIN